ncbi:unnamed protein product [Pleuronectes platessa]|uniref:Uncharacterized protein n=1 Tax=Pleuronectes platessa TaxID=8262 RepID=A0A9N7UIP4_PLEPL|nr:unnamed protein product [Pleuronectes platessa]
MLPRRSSHRVRGDRRPPGASPSLPGCPTVSIRSTSERRYHGPGVEPVSTGAERSTAEDPLSILPEFLRFDCTVTVCHFGLFTRVSRFASVSSDSGSATRPRPLCVFGSAERSAPRDALQLGDSAARASHGVSKITTDRKTTELSVPVERRHRPTERKQVHRQAQDVAGRPRGDLRRSLSGSLFGKRQKGGTRRRKNFCLQRKISVKITMVRPPGYRRGPILARLS